MSDVTAVVLTIGEDTTPRALASVRNRTLPPAEIIVIKNVTPFHNAMNLGASRVKTEFFVQVDADMILDEYCFEDLRTCMAKDVGIALGHLRDKLIPRVCGIRMVRRKCFDKIQLPNSISPSVDFVNDVVKEGWTVVYTLRSIGSNKKVWHTFGEHRPNYTPDYTYSKHLLLGRRYRYRKDLGGLLWHLAELKNSNHSVSLIAQVAMAHGVFLEGDEDLLTPFSENEDFTFLEKFLPSTGNYKVSKLNILPFFLFSPNKAFRKYHELGMALRKSNSFTGFKSCMDILHASHDAFAWIAEVGLCHGLFSTNYGEQKFEKENAMLHELLSEYDLAFVLKNKIKCVLQMLYASFSHLMNKTQ